MQVKRIGVLWAAVLLVIASCSNSSTVTQTTAAPAPTTAAVTTAEPPVASTVVPESEPAAPAAPTPEPSPVPSPTPAPDALSNFSEEMVEEAIARAIESPPPALPGRDVVSTDRLIAEMTDAGIDLTGVDLVVYPAAQAPSFVLVVGDEGTTALDAEEVGGAPSSGEVFMRALLDSPTLIERDIEQLVLEFAGTDDEGPFVVTFRTALEAVRLSVANDTELGLDNFSVQAVRP